MASPFPMASSGYAFRQRPACWRAATTRAASWNISLRGIYPKAGFTRARIRTARNPINRYSSQRCLRRPMPKKFSQRAEDLRRALAQEAARIMAEHGIEDFLQAKRKAADRLGVNDVAVLPKKEEIEDALRGDHRLFERHTPHN